MIESIVIGVLALIGAFLYGGKKKQEEVTVKQKEIKDEEKKQVKAIEKAVDDSSLSSLVASNNDKFKGSE